MIGNELQRKCKAMNGRGNAKQRDAKKRKTRREIKKMRRKYRIREGSIAWCVVGVAKRIPMLALSLAAFLAVCEVSKIVLF